MKTRLAQPSLTSSWTVNDVLRYFPTTVLVFNDLGIDTCCGGMATLEDAARDAAMTSPDLLAALESCLSKDSEPVSWTDRLLGKVR
jgi:iron-sulfur cluster repair protein YtfE (RIC family)